MPSGYSVEKDSSWKHVHLQEIIGLDTKEHKRALPNLQSTLGAKDTSKLVLFKTINYKFLSKLNKSVKKRTF